MVFMPSTEAVGTILSGIRRTKRHIMLKVRFINLLIITLLPTGSGCETISYMGGSGSYPLATQTSLSKASAIRVESPQRVIVVISGSEELAVLRQLLSEPTPEVIDAGVAISYSRPRIRIDLLNADAKVSTMAVFPDEGFGYSEEGRYVKVAPRTIEFLKSQLGKQAVKGAATKGVAATKRDGSL